MSQGIRWRIYAPWAMPALLLLVVAASVLWRAPNLDAFGLSNDEGSHLMWAMHRNEGHELYKDTRTLQSPVFLELVALSLRIGGPENRAASARWMVVLFGVVVLLAVAMVARVVGGWGAALASAAILSAAPLFFQFSRMVRGDVISAAFFCLSVLLAYLYRRGGGRWWLAASGALFGTSIITKALNPFAFVLFFVLIYQSHQKRAGGTRRGALVDAATWGTCGLLVVAAPFAFYDARALWDTLVTFRSDLRAAVPWNLADNFYMLRNFFSSPVEFPGGYAPTMAMALYGLVYLGIYERAGSREGGRVFDEAVPLVVWVCVVVATLFWHTPLFRHHFITLLVPAALAAGVGVEGTLRLMRGWEGGTRRDRVMAMVGVGLILYVLSAIPGWVQQDNGYVAAVTGGREAEAIGFIGRVTASGDYVISDNQMLVVMADRRTPPHLGDIALVGIQSGRQTSDNLICLTREYDVPVVASWGQRIPWLPEYEEWLDGNFVVKKKWDDFHVIYYALRKDEAGIENRLNVTFGDGEVELLGYGLRGGGPEPGGELAVTLYWRAARKIDADYTVFVHVIDGAGDSGGGPLAQHDGPPLYGELHTYDWTVGEIVPDTHVVPLPGDMQGGSYVLGVGMYDSMTMQRLTPRAEGMAFEGGMVSLGEVSIE